MPFHDFLCAVAQALVIFAAVCYNVGITRKEVNPLDFKKITLSDVGALRPYLRAQYRSCDYSVLGVFMWADRFGYEYNITDGVLFMRERSRSGGEYDYLLPLGEGSLIEFGRCAMPSVESSR